MRDALERIREQADKALANEDPAPGVLLGLYGLTREEVWLGNIYAIAKVALNR